jgi:hypothetical protein
MFEALVMALIRRIPVKTAATILGTGDARLWRLVDREVGKELLEPGGAGSSVLERRSGRKGRDVRNLFYDLDVSFDTQLEQGNTAASVSSAEELALNKDMSRKLGLTSRELSKAFILAAIAKFVRAARTHQQFKISKFLNNVLGKVGAEEGMLDPGKSRAPPQTDCPARGAA